MEGAAVTVDGVEGQVGISTTDGLFRILSVPSGSHTLVVRHVAYGEHRQAIRVPVDSAFVARIDLSAAAIVLDPLVVEVRSPREARARARGTATMEVTREEIDDGARAGKNVAEIVRDHVPGAQLRQSTYLVGARACLEIRGAAAGLGGLCRSPRVYLDGVPVSEPRDLYRALDPATVERMEILGPAEAGVLYGPGAAWGVLLIETRLRSQPVDSLAAATALNRLGVWNWRLEPEGHATGRVLAMALLADAVGLTVGLLAADRCFDRASHPRYDVYVSRCGNLGTGLAGAAAFALPIASTTLATRRAGRSDLSQGSLFPSIMAGSALLVASYSLVLSRHWDGSRKYEIAGGLLAAVGVPLVVTATDYLFRRVRGVDRPGERPPR